MGHDPLEVKANHESGHEVIAWPLELNVHKVSIVPDEQGEGQIRPREEPGLLVN